MTDELTSWLLSFDSGKRWNNNIESPDTKRLYLSRLKQYCDWAKKNPDELIAFKLEGLQNLNTEKEFQAEELLDSFLYNDLKDKTSVQIAVCTSVKSFYSATRGRALTDDVGSKISALECKKRTPSMTDLLELDEVMITQRDRSILWFLQSCPLRVSSLMQLFWRDLQPTNDPQAPYKIVIESRRLKGHGKGRYVGTKHIGFLHYYAAAKLEKYKAELKEKKIDVTPDSPIFVAYNSNPYHQVKGGRLQKINSIFDDASFLGMERLE